MAYLLFIFKAAVLSLIYHAYADTKIWMRNTNYNNTNNWIPRRLPAEADLAVFPYYLNVELALSSEISVCKMVLPYGGLILFPTDGFLQINDRRCDFTNRVNFVRNKVERWENPLNWLSTKGNAATPHALKIPCPFDDVIFPPSSTFAVGLPPAQIVVKSFQINHQNLDSEELRSFLVDSVSGRKQFIKDDDYASIPIVSGAGCTDPTGCSCGTERLMQLSCHLFPPRICPPLKCVDPVKPIGHCCYICGVTLEFQFDRKKFKMSELRLTLESFVSLVLNERKSNLVFHSGKTDSGSIQIVLIEKDGYEGIVTDVAHQLETRLLSDQKLGLSHSKLLLSGEPLPSGALSVFKTFIAVILIVIVAFLCVMLYRSDMHFDQLFSSAAFANFVRFENQTGEVEMQYEAQPQLRKSFYNPLFKNAVADNEIEKPEQNPDEIPSVSYGTLSQETTAAPECKNDTGDVEMDEMPAPKFEEKLLHDVDLN